MDFTEPLSVPVKQWTRKLSWSPVGLYLYKHTSIT